MLRVSGPTQQRYVAQYLDLHPYLERYHQAKLRRLIIQRRQTGWMIMLKVIRKGHNQIAYFERTTYLEVILLVGEMIGTTSITWHSDRY